MDESAKAKGWNMAEEVDIPVKKRILGPDSTPNSVVKMVPYGVGMYRGGLGKSVGGQGFGREVCISSSRGDRMAVGSSTRREESLQNNDGLGADDILRAAQMITLWFAGSCRCALVDELLKCLVSGRTTTHL